MAQHTNEARERRIIDEIVVDAYDAQERALGWYYYLEEQLRFPFHARCTRSHPLSPLRRDEEVEVVKMPPEEVCEHEMFVTIEWENRTFAVPLSQLEPLEVDAETQQGLEDWRYWKQQNYQF